MPSPSLLDLPSPFGAPLWSVEETGSTMDEARSLALAGAPPGTLVVADHQVAGRGRQGGRTWLAPARTSLLATLVLDPALAALPGLTVRVGLALARACEAWAGLMGSPIHVSLKWPNDLLAGGLKLGGVLCEAGTAGLFVGFGLNLSQEGFPPPLASTATSLALATGRGDSPLGPWPAGRDRLLVLALGELARALEEEGWREEAEKRLWRRGESVALPPSGGRGGAATAARRARILGLDGDGALLVEPAGGGRERLLSGEIGAGESR